MKQCDRCDEPVKSSSTSYFNTDTVCLPCKEDERLAPNFYHAEQAEIAACKAGNFNFKGIGLAPADRKFLAERRKNRSK